MEGLGAKLSRAEVGGVGQFVAIYEVLEEWEDVELGERGRVLWCNETEDLLAGLVVLAYVECAGDGISWVF